MAESGSAAYYRAIKDGNWSDTSTWEASTDGGTSWSAATGYPGDTSGVQDIVYDLQGYIITYNINMPGSVTFDNTNVTDGEVVLPDEDPGIDLTINGGLLKFLKFDLATKSWDRNININLDGNRLKNCTIKDDTPLLVVKVVSETSSTEKVVKLYDLQRKAYVEDVTGTEIQAGQTIWYDYSNSDTISNVSYNSATGEFTITLNSGITTLGVGDLMAIETQKIKILSSNYGGMNYDFSSFENVFLKWTGTTSLAGTIRNYRGNYGKYVNSILLLSGRSPYVVGKNNFISTVDTGLGSTYGGYSLQDCFWDRQYVIYDYIDAANCIFRNAKPTYYSEKLQNIYFVTPVAFQSSFYYQHFKKRYSYLRNLSSFTFSFNAGYWYGEPLLLRKIRISGVDNDFLFYEKGGYLQRNYNNGYWEAIGDAWYYAEGEVKTAITGPLCFYHQNASGGTGTVQVYVNGALVREESFTLSATKTIQCVDIAVKPGDNVQIYISVPDETLLWTDAIEERFNAGDKFQCC